ncbi:MAG: aminotransferase-like domain-containing protein [Candidatus Aquicultorales bacterium]
MTELDFDHWKDLYASRTAKMRSSEVRNMLAVTQRPDIISLAGGNPDLKAFPCHYISEATAKVMSAGHSALQYGPSEGIAGLKKCLIKLMAEDDIHVDLDDFIITDGGQQALELLAKIFIGTGDTIIVEGPSYLGAVQAFSGYEPNYVLIPLDEDGLDTDILEHELAKLKKEKVKPKFLYTVPNFHNPAGVTLSLERRKRVLELAHEHDILVIEDNPYGWLRYSGEPLPSLRSMDDERVIYISTLSKIFSPGMRIGWVSTPKPVLEKLIFAKQAADLCSSTFTQLVAEEYFTNFPWREQIDRTIETYRGRRDAMLSALERFMPEGTTWTKPKGGLFVWATLPGQIDAGEMLAEAIQKAKVAYISGRSFYPDGSGKNNMRLNFSFCEEGVITEGIERLSEVVAEQIALYESFYGSKEPSRLEE